MPGLSTPFLVSIYCWFAWEGGLLVRDLVRRKGRLGPDRGTRVLGDQYRSYQKATRRLVPGLW